MKKNSTTSVRIILSSRCNSIEKLSSIRKVFSFSKNNLFIHVSQNGSLNAKCLYLKTSSTNQYYVLEEILYINVIIQCCSFQSIEYLWNKMLDGAGKEKKYKVNKYQHYKGIIRHFHSIFKETFQAFI